LDFRDALPLLVLPQHGENFGPGPAMLLATARSDNARLIDPFLAYFDFDQKSMSLKHLQPFPQGR
jgi:hypothetical protein